jgi:hypothetical protein
MIYDEKFRDLSGRLSADIVVPFLCQNLILPATVFFLAQEYLAIFRNTSRTINLGTFPPI